MSAEEVIGAVDVTLADHHLVGDASKEESTLCGQGLAVEAAGVMWAADGQRAFEADDRESAKDAGLHIPCRRCAVEATRLAAIHLLDILP